MLYGDNSVFTHNLPEPNWEAILQSCNLYVYVMANPFKWIDPSGLDAIILLDNSRGSQSTANPFGHMALAIQHSNDSWWIMDFRQVGYRGPDWLPIRPPNVEVVFAPLEINELGPDGLSIRCATFEFTGVNNGYILEGCISRYNVQSFIEGDFMDSWRKALYYSRINQPSFNIIGSNCAWLAIEVLAASTSGQTYENLQNMLWMSTSLETPFGTINFPYHRRPIIPNTDISRIELIMRDGGFNVHRRVNPGPSNVCDLC